MGVQKSDTRELGSTLSVPLATWTRWIPSSDTYAACRPSGESVVICFPLTILLMWPLVKSTAQTERVGPSAPETTTPPDWNPWYGTSVTTDAVEVTLGDGRSDETAGTTARLFRIRVTGGRCVATPTVIPSPTSIAAPTP